MNDEIGGLPCGQRIVEAEIGRKWVYVRERVGGGHRHKVSVPVWNGLRPAPIVVRKGRR